MKKKDFKEFSKREERYLREREEREEFQARCDHKLEKKGKMVSTLRPVNGSNELECPVCGARVKFEAASIKDLRDAKELLLNVLHQVKAVEDLNDGILMQIGFVSMFLNRVEDLYDGTRTELTRRSGAGNQSNNDDRYDYSYENFGNYAASNRPMSIYDYEDKKHKNKNKGKGKDKDYDKKKKKKKNW